METTNRTKKVVVLGMLTAILILMALTPLGYLRVGALSITFNMIPVSIGAIAIGKKGGAFLGGVFGLTSFLSCMGIIVPLDPFGAELLSISFVNTMIMCFVPRIIDGFLAGLISEKLVHLIKNKSLGFGIVGFGAAVINTVLFMSALVLLFGKTEFIINIWNSIALGKNVLLFVCAFVGVNALVEILAATLITSFVAYGLYKSKLIRL